MNAKQRLIDASDYKPDDRLEVLEIMTTIDKIEDAATDKEGDGEYILVTVRQASLMLRAAVDRNFDALRPETRTIIKM